ncbi:MAG: DUF1156 domain-containing protein [Deltaproteobacteria bacterium]|nr:DUF1156 domain-containing protein [Deltaproteobacteria bacterium]
MNKKLIEVALPLEVINKASGREKSIRHGHPSTLHLWWSRKPLATARAILFASLVDDPSAHPELFPTDAAQVAERDRLFKLIEELVVWENSNNSKLLATAQAEIKKSCGETQLEFLDPFAGGGSIPLEAQRLGLKVQASDLNPVAVMINKAMLEIPPRFAGRPPVNPESARSNVNGGEWVRAAGLAEDVAYYAELLRKEALAKIGHLYPTIELPGQQGSSQSAQVVAWIWARNVKCPNPACGCQMPLVNSFVIANRKDNAVFATPVFKNKNIFYDISNEGPTLSKTFSSNGAICAICHSPVSLPYVREEGKNQRMGSSLLAIVAQGQVGKVYLPANDMHVKASDIPRITFDNDLEIPHDPRVFTTPNYGLTHYSDLFTSRQLMFLTTLTDLIHNIQSIIQTDSIKAGLENNNISLEEGGTGAYAYSQAVAVYLSLLKDKMTDFHSNLTTWNAKMESFRGVFSRQALPLMWVYAEGNPFSEATGSLKNMIEWVVKAVRALPANNQAVVKLADAQTDNIPKNIVISTDPPYYDNIGYADLSDFYYIWLRQSLRKIYKSVFNTILVPKNEELVAAPYRFSGDKMEAKIFFESGLKKVFGNFYQNGSNDFPITIYYAFKQSDAISEDDGGAISSTGWETMLSALIDSGFSITGTWPIKSERGNRPRSLGSNALASSIVLVCRKRPKEAPSCSTRDFRGYLRAELKPALLELQRANIAPVDLAQAAIGPGMAIFSRYSSILNTDGSIMPVRVALGFINEELDKYLTEQESHIDTDSAFCVTLFSQISFGNMNFGDVEVLAKAKNASIERLREKKVLFAEKGVVRLFGLREIPTVIKPQEENVWLLTHQLTRGLESGGIKACARIALEVDNNAQVGLARDLAYRLYNICDRKKWATEALAYNSLVQAWPEIQLAIIDSKNSKKDIDNAKLF